MRVFFMMTSQFDHSKQFHRYLFQSFSGFSLICNFFPDLSDTSSTKKPINPILSGFYSTRFSYYETKVWKRRTTITQYTSRTATLLNSSRSKTVRQIDSANYLFMRFDEIQMCHFFLICKPAFHCVFRLCASDIEFIVKSFYLKSK